MSECRHMHATQSHLQEQVTNTEPIEVLEITSGPTEMWKIMEMLFRHDPNNRMLLVLGGTYDDRAITHEFTVTGVQHDTEGNPVLAGIVAKRDALYELKSHLLSIFPSSAFNPNDKVNIHRPHNPNYTE